MSVDLLRATAVKLQSLPQNGKITSLELVRIYRQQMLDHNDRLKAIITISPLSFTESLARKLDEERKNGHVRSPIHGVPFVVKDALNTSDEYQFQSTNGGWAFEDSQPYDTARVIKQMTDAGGILIGKANLSQFGNWKASSMSGGWSARGGQTQPAYVNGGVVNDGIYAHSNSPGSSTGSAVAVSAGFAPFSIDADFNGSLTNPAIRAALYTLRTTPGTVPEEGGFPFARDRDSVGAMAKCTEDLINLLNIMTAKSHPNVPTDGYVQSTGSVWKDVSIAVLDPSRWHLPKEVQEQRPGTLEQIPLVQRMEGPAELISEDKLSESSSQAIRLIKNDFSNLFDEYIKGLKAPKVKGLKELVEFNEQNKDLELPPDFPKQDNLIESLQESNGLSTTEYDSIDQYLTTLAGPDGIDRILQDYGADIILGPADSRIPDVTALARYPSNTLPLGYLDWNGRPFGILAVASKYQEQLLLDFASLWESTFPPRIPPKL